MQTYQRNYNDDLEELNRYNIWQANKKIVEVHNAGNHSFTLGMNQYADLENKEFVSMMNGYRSDLRSQSHSTEVFKYNSTGPKMDTVDWRTKGYVTEIKNQGQCGSCWAFSTTGSLEGQLFNATGKLVSLSEQDLVDCSDKYGNNGCKGGLMDNAFRYIKANDGIDTEASYPYRAHDERCTFNANNVGAMLTGFVDVPHGNEDALMSAAGSVGPISVAIDASHSSFQLYKKGVYYEERCSSSKLDHGVLVVGYGTESGGDYWLVKNSWGTRWGMEGYINMARNKNNNCGIATQASYPTV